MHTPVWVFFDPRRGVGPLQIIFVSRQPPRTENAYHCMPLHKTCSHERVYRINDTPRAPCDFFIGRTDSQPPESAFCSHVLTHACMARRAGRAWPRSVPVFNAAFSSILALHFTFPHVACLRLRAAQQCVAPPRDRSDSRCRGALAPLRRRRRCSGISVLRSRRRGARGRAGSVAVATVSWWCTPRAAFLAPRMRRQ